MDNISPEEFPKPSYPKTEGPNAHAIRKARWAAIDPDKPLTRRERLFVAEYMKDLQAGSALARTGRGGSNPDKRAHEILKRANVAKAVDAAVKQREEAAAVTVERLEKAYSEFAFARHVGPILPAHRLAALDSLAKYKGMFKPETQTVIPVVFQFLGAPSLPTDAALAGQVIDAKPVESQPAALPASLEPPKR